MGTLKPQSSGPRHSNAVIRTLAIDGWSVIFGTVRKAWVGCSPTQSPLGCTKYNSPPINGQCTNFLLFNVALKLPLLSKRLIKIAV